ncbi:hypothetical protein BDK51DRAFT_38904 [Blyttiomyces helicus]|uniref:Uncharacterized protein n=1 Tax=Blyttiomyces helicus TaxID=388810 RepID=A0A4P9VWE0_9FUNG|nr:hypothetical protein BDK51DRAFT_38904 [Blyttiomyces helicus]|eukprot:RKO84011.1 hypothetical protein BDK51DRAFT_38904 [Blyttiomyces helicus]
MGSWIMPGLDGDGCGQWDFLATARPASAQSNNAQKTFISLDHTQLLCIDVGPRDTEKHRFLNGAEAASSDETCEYDFPLSRLLSAPLPIDAARYLLSVFSALHSDSPEGGVDVPTPLPALFVLQAEEASAGRKSYVGVEACSDKKGGPASRHVIKLNEHARGALLGDEAEGSRKGGPLGSIVMDVRWKGAQELLGTPPPSADVLMEIRGISGTRDPENHLPTAVLRTELAKLMKWDAIRRGVAECDTTSASKGLVPAVLAFLKPAESEDDLVDALEPLIDELESACFRW